MEDPLGPILPIEMNKQTPIFRVFFLTPAERRKLALRGMIGCGKIHHVIYLKQFQLLERNLLAL